MKEFVGSRGVEIPQVAFNKRRVSEAKMRLYCAFCGSKM